MNKQGLKNFFGDFLATQRNTLQLLEIKRPHAIPTFNDLAQCKNIVVGESQSFNFC